MANLRLADTGGREMPTLTGPKYLLRAYVAIGASGAVTQASCVYDQGITVTQNGAGTYDIVYPANAAMTLDVMVQSAAGTVLGAYQTANIPPNGTATIKTWGESAGSIAVTNPANGDALNILFIGFPYTAE